jgi:hypothetical protein
VCDYIVKIETPQDRVQRKAVVNMTTKCPVLRIRNYKAFLAQFSDCGQGFCSLYVYVMSFITWKIRTTVEYRWYAAYSSSVALSSVMPFKYIFHYTTLHMLRTSAECSLDQLTFISTLAASLYEKAVEIFIPFVSSYCCYRFSRAALEANAVRHSLKAKFYLIFFVLIYGYNSI